jgi:hypothetical protein
MNMSADERWPKPLRSDEGHLLHGEARSAGGGEVVLILQLTHLPDTQDVMFTFDRESYRDFADSISRLATPAFGDDDLPHVPPPWEFLQAA